MQEFSCFFLCNLFSLVTFLFTDVCLSTCVRVCAVNNQELPFVTCFQGPRGGRGRTGAHAAPSPCDLSPRAKVHVQQFCLSLPLALSSTYALSHCLLLLAVSVSVWVSVSVGVCVGRRVVPDCLVETWVTGLPLAVGATRPVLPCSLGSCA